LLTTATRHCFVSCVCGNAQPTHSFKNIPSHPDTKNSTLNSMYTESMGSRWYTSDFKMVTIDILVCLRPRFIYRHRIDHCQVPVDMGWQFHSQILLMRPKTDGRKYVGICLHSPILSENVVLKLAPRQLYLSYLVRSGSHIAAQLGHFIEHALRKLGKCFNDNWLNKRCYCLELICCRQRPRQPLHKERLCRQTLSPDVPTRN